jgi:translation initiation factor IF-3
MFKNHESEKLASELKINGQIGARDVRLVGSGGDMLGVVPLARALALARTEGLDLVEIAPNSEPPVCKIADYGKIRYQTQKKVAEAKKRQKTVDVKEIKLSPNIALGDYEVKMKQARKFFSQGNSVRFSFFFRGREIVHANLAEDMAGRMVEQLGDIAKVMTAPRLEGKRLFFLLAPAVKKQ